MAFSDKKRHVMNIIDSPPPESFAPDPTPTALDLARTWACYARSWVITWRLTRSRDAWGNAMMCGRNADAWAVKASVTEGGVR